MNVVAENYKTGVYSLHRLDVSKHLFHQSRADARGVPFLAEAEDNSAAGSHEQPILELREACVKIHPSSRTNESVMVMVKLPFWARLNPRSSEDKVLCINCMGDAALCDADIQSVSPMLPLREEVGGDPISFSVDAQDREGEENLYVIHTAPRLGVDHSCFHMLRSYDSEEGVRWRWESLPPPPFVYNPGLVIYSYLVVDRTICVSSSNHEGFGTYCFNTVERQWRHAGHLILPFQGRAMYDPDLKLWLGFSSISPDYNLCGTSDLNSAMATTDGQLKLQYVWQDIVMPENWWAARTELVGLGSGRFCIAKAFVVFNCYTGKSDGFDDDCGYVEDEVLVLTGVEVGRSGDGRLMVWKHKSVQYRSNSIKGVL